MWTGQSRAKSERRPYDSLILRVLVRFHGSKDGVCFCPSVVFESEVEHQVCCLLLSLH